MTPEEARAASEAGVPFLVSTRWARKQVEAHGEDWAAFVSALGPADETTQLDAWLVFAFLGY